MIGTLTIVAWAVLHVLVFSTPHAECIERQDWPWTGEVTLDGFLASERLDQHLHFFKQRLGCDDLLDVLFVQPGDLSGVLTIYEQNRFFRRAQHLRHWQAIQRKYYAKVPKFWHQWREDGPNSKTSPNITPPFEQGYWQNATVGLYLGFLDSAQEAISESNALSLKQRRAMQSIKEIRANFVTSWLKWRSSGIASPSASLYKMLSFLGSTSRREKNDTCKKTSPSQDPIFDCIDRVRRALRRASIGSREGFQGYGSMIGASRHLSNLVHNLENRIGTPTTVGLGTTVMFYHNASLCKVFVCMERRLNKHVIENGWLGAHICKDGAHLKPTHYLTRVLSQDETKWPILVSVSCFSKAGPKRNWMNPGQGRATPGPLNDIFEQR